MWSVATVQYKRRPSEGCGNDSHACNFGSSSRIRYYYDTAPLKMNLGVSKNIMIDSIDELHLRDNYSNKKRTEISIKNNEIEG